MTTASRRNNVQLSGVGERPIVFMHGYGCDQTVWRFVAPEFESAYRVVLFDHVGCGQSDWSCYDPVRYDSLQGYAEDVLEICRELSLDDAILVGHSVSGMISALAAIKEPSRFSALVMIGPSPSYINDGNYPGGFALKDVEELLELLDSNHIGWAATMAPVIMGNPGRPELATELRDLFCRMDPEIAKRFGRVCFLSDHRADLPKVRTRSLILQCSDDALVPPGVAAYLHRHIVGSELVVMRATGHCPHLSEPAETVAAIRAFLAGPSNRQA